MNLLSGRQPLSARVGLISLILVGLIAVVVLITFWRSANQAEPAFLKAMQAGKTYLEKNEPAKAAAEFQRSIELRPANADAHLNLAIAYLQADQPDAALVQAARSLELDQESAAAHYVSGVAHLRLGQNEKAVQSLQTSQNLDPSVAAVHFQLGLAHANLRQWEEAAAAYRAATDWNPEHPAAYYNLSQALIRADQPDEAEAALELHQEIAASRAGQTLDPKAFEQCKHLQAKVPFQLEQPDPAGLEIAFVDATAETFPNLGGEPLLDGPFGVIDVGHNGWMDLFLVRGQDQFQLLTNHNGTFQVASLPVAGTDGATYTKCLVGDLENDAMQADRFEDILMLGPDAIHVFKILPPNFIQEVTPYTQLADVKAIDGGLVDLDFTGKLDLLTVTTTNSLQLHRNLGNLMFQNITATSGIPASVNSAVQVVIDDWHRDDIRDVFAARADQAPLFLAKLRGGPLVLTNLPAPLSPADRIAVGDLNNDLQNDLLSLSSNQFTVLYGGIDEPARFDSKSSPTAGLTLLDYDNDGWLDIITFGKGIRIWRNLGTDGFVDQTAQLGLDAYHNRTFKSLAFADFDYDGDTDLLLSQTEGSGPAGHLLYLKNNGGNANLQLKLQLAGNRSNPSGLGVRIEVASGGLRLARTVSQLPVEIGVGQHRQLEAVTVRWFDLSMDSVDVEVDPLERMFVSELTLPSGSCPYLYTWDGKRFRFVTDLLGTAPAGLPVAEGVYITADSREITWIGDETNVAPKEGDYILQITEELREVLFLDECKLLVVDHPPGTTVVSTDKLVPGKPFPTGEIVTVQNSIPLRHAERHDGLDLTDALQAVDQVMASPAQLRAPQMRGLAEPYSITLDFGPLPADRPLALVMNGWLHFGGGMANIAASHRPDLPFPFPVLEALTPGGWQALDLVMGAPAGKTKRILVDLTDVLPPETSQLRITAAFEIHWDWIGLFEKAPRAATQVNTLSPTRADLHWRGYSPFLDQSSYLPLTPNYEEVFQKPFWSITPSGWCTRYGQVLELVQQTDDALVIMNGGDELTLHFPADQLPAKPPGYQRDFFILTDGWDKDADFHVAAGWKIEPIPWHGMDDQLYGRQPRPPMANDGWIKKYNTRWVAPFTFDRPLVKARPEE